MRNYCQNMQRRNRLLFRVLMDMLKPLNASLLIRVHVTFPGFALPCDSNAHCIFDKYFMGFIVSLKA